MALAIACRYGLSNKLSFNIVRNRSCIPVRYLFTVFKRQATTQSILDVNTNVAKDVVLYKNDASRQFKLLNLFAVAQFVFWNFLAETVFSTLKDIPVDKLNKNGPWYTKINFGKDAARYSLTALCLIVG